MKINYRVAIYAQDKWMTKEQTWAGFSNPINIFTFSLDLKSAGVCVEGKKWINTGTGQVALPTHLAEEEVLLASTGKVSPPTQQLWEKMNHWGGCAAW